MGWYRVVKTVKGHRYAYWQTSWREGAHVRTYSIYIGRADDGWGRMPGPFVPHGRDSHRLPGHEPQNGAGASASGDLQRAGEDAFISALLAYEGERPTTVAYSWSRPGLKTAMALDDAEVIALPVRMGVRVMSRFRKTGRRAQHSCPMYLPSRHTIVVPDPSRYREHLGASRGRAYLADLLHEVVHSTIKVMKRPFWNFDHRAYAREEIVAELGANLILRRLGLAQEDTRRAEIYLAGWQRRLSHEDLAWAVQEAKRAADYVLSFHSRGGWDGKPGSYHDLGSREAPDELALSDIPW